MFPYVSARSRAQLVDALLAAQLALYVLRALGGCVQLAAPYSDLATMCARGERLSQPFLLVLFIGATIAFLFWIDRCARNLPALGVTKAIGPEHALGVFFAPPLNLVAIPYVVRYVWYRSDPTPPRMGATFVAAWWGCFVVGALLALWASVPALPSSLAMAASALALVHIVRDTQRRQDEQFRDDELRRAVPQPTADALR